MRTILVSILCLSVISAFAAEQKNKNKGGQKGGGGPAGHQQTHVSGAKVHKGNVNLQPQHNLSPMQKNTNLTNKHITNKNISKTNVTNKTVNKTFNKTVNKNITHFNLGNKPHPNIPAAKFQAGVHIHNSHMWVGPRYVVFRNYVPIWHDQVWWVGHHSNFVFVFGAPYYWDAGYWYPAWGYYPGATYYYEGPIYASSPTVTPEDMVANVQSALQQQTNAEGQPYYQGEIDGVLGPQTRAAIASYQQDHGLYTTSAIDEPTLDSLGLS